MVVYMSVVPVILEQRDVLEDSRIPVCVHWRMLNAIRVPNNCGNPRVSSQVKDELLPSLSLVKEEIGPCMIPTKGLLDEDLEFVDADDWRRSQDLFQKMCRWYVMNAHGLLSHC